MLAALRPKPIREPEKLHFVNGVQNLDDGTLDDFVLQRRNTERPLPPVRLRDVRPSNWLRSIRSSPQLFRKSLEVCFQLLPVVLPRLSVDARRCFPLQCGVGLAKATDIVNVVEERGESLPASPLCCLTYPLERTVQADSAQCPRLVALRRVSFGQPPSLHPLRCRSLGFVRRLLRYYEAVRLPVPVHRRFAPLGFPVAA